jgi:integrase
LCPRPSVSRLCATQSDAEAARAAAERRLRQSDLTAGGSDERPMRRTERPAKATNTAATKPRVMVRRGKAQPVAAMAEPEPVKSHVFTVGSPNSFKVRIGRMITRAGLEDLTFHDLRHEATSRLAKRYLNPMDLKRVTGHLTLKSLDRYYQPDLSELAEQSSITSPVVPSSLPSLGGLADVEAFAVADSVQSMP